MCSPYLSAFGAKLKTAIGPKRTFRMIKTLYYGQNLGDTFNQRGAPHRRRRMFLEAWNFPLPKKTVIFQRC
ncbi:hypothetical protein SRABI05_04322 [Agrobacterium fabrum]|nr:hypothetical protein SRABI46_04293 [Agrobacterium fabrum]CAH0298569.1 hypothetical protein SRABI05_04322 [Agrobacterium fabrum]